MSTKNWLLFLGGLAAGAVIASLLAPENGAELRARLAKKLEERGINRDRLDEIIEKIKQRWAQAKNTRLDDIINQILDSEPSDADAPQQDPQPDQQA